MRQTPFVSSPSTACQGRRSGRASARSAEVETSDRAQRDTSLPLGSGSRLRSTQTESGAGIGTLAGIARHAYPKAPMEVLDHVEVTIEGGVTGDFRGAVKPGGRGRRQVTLMERGDWEAAMADVGHAIPWQERRANLLVDGMDLPQSPGIQLRIGTNVILEITRETDPCERMEALATGLKAALSVDWRGGVCTRVKTGGRIAVGDDIRIEDS